MLSHLLLIFLHLSMPIPTTFATNLVTKLIHYDSSTSPKLNPIDTAHRRAERSIQRSLSRFAFISSKLSNLPSSNEIYQMDLVPNKVLPQFLVNISIGDPPTPQLVVMDTGSSLFWVKCLPCKSCSAGTFDPSKSSTYRNLPCQDAYHCGSYTCSPSNVCSYSIRYVQGPSSAGYLSSERITVRNLNGVASVDDVLIGCGHENGHFVDGYVNGVLGLGMTRMDNTLARQLGKKFAYCTGDMHNPHYVDNRLSIGDGVEFEGSSTPLRSMNGHYYLNLEGISVGVMRLKIDPVLFKKLPQVNNGVIIDSGTGLSFIAKGAFERLSRRIRELMDDGFSRVDNKPLPLCYEGYIEELRDFPIISFHFANGADLVLDYKSSFFQARPRVICSSFVPSDINKGNHENLTIIGMMAQQNYNVGYDLDTMHIHFQNIDCQFLDYL